MPVIAGVFCPLPLTGPIFMGDNEPSLPAIGPQFMSTTKTTLEMSETLFRRAKATAAGRGQTLSFRLGGDLS